MKLQITKDAYLKLKYYIGLVDTEISGMGKSHIDETGNIIMTDLVIFEQEVSGATTILSDSSQAKFINELMKANEDTAHWNIWWHSHANMNVFWSATDDKTIEDHANGQSYLISLVGNRKKEYKARIDIFPTDTSPFKFSGITYKEDLDFEILEDQENQEQIEKIELAIKNAKEKIKELKGLSNPEIRKYCQDDISLKVKEKVYPTYNANRNWMGGYNRNRRTQNKWQWEGDNQEALLDDVVDYSKLDENRDIGYDDGSYYPGGQFKCGYNNPFQDTCFECGFTQAQCSNNNSCVNALENKEIVSNYLNE